MSVSINEISDVFVNMQFSKIKRDKELFIWNDQSDLSCAYYVNIQRKMKKIRLSGAFGTYCAEFEDKWWNSISNNDRKYDKTLPLIMLIDNFWHILNDDYFDYSNDINKISTDVQDISKICRQFPNSIDELIECFVKGSILGKNISEYHHIRDYLDDNLYKEKSLSFFTWLIKKRPDSEAIILSRLNENQRRKLAAYQKMHHETAFE